MRFWTCPLCKDNVHGEAVAGQYLCNACIDGHFKVFAKHVLQRFWTRLSRRRVAA